MQRDSDKRSHPREKSAKKGNEDHEDRFALHRKKSLLFLRHTSRPDQATLENAPHDAAHRNSVHQAEKP